MGCSGDLLGSFLEASMNEGDIVIPGTSDRREGDNKSLEPGR